MKSRTAPLATVCLGILITLGADAMGQQANEREATLRGVAATKSCAIRELKFEEKDRQITFQYGDPSNPQVRQSCRRTHTKTFWIPTGRGDFFVVAVANADEHFNDGECGSGIDWRYIVQESKRFPQDPTALLEDKLRAHHNCAPGNCYTFSLRVAEPYESYFVTKSLAPDVVAYKCAVYPQSCPCFFP